MNLECYCGPYIEPSKLKTLQSVYNGNMVAVLKDVLENIIRCAIDPKTVFGFLKPGNTSLFILLVLFDNRYTFFSSRASKLRMQQGKF